MTNLLGLPRELRQMAYKDVLPSDHLITINPGPVPSKEKAILDLLSSSDLVSEDVSWVIQQYCSPRIVIRKDLEASLDELVVCATSKGIDMGKAKSIEILVDCKSSATNIYDISIYGRPLAEFITEEQRDKGLVGSLAKKVRVLFQELCEFFHPETPPSLTIRFRESQNPDSSRYEFWTECFECNWYRRPGPVISLLRYDLILVFLKLLRRQCEDRPRFQSVHIKPLMEFSALDLLALGDDVDDNFYLREKERNIRALMQASRGTEEFLTAG